MTDTAQRHDPQWRAQMLRLMKTGRSPEQTVLVRELFADTLLHVDLNERPKFHPRTGPDSRTANEIVIAAQNNNDMFAREMLTQNDTVLMFAGPQFCDLIAATDAPPVMDLSVLSPVGNRTVMVAYARNMQTAVPGDALVGLMLHRTEVMDDGNARLLGITLHEDRSVSTFMRPITEVGPDLVQVHWGTGFEFRELFDADTEQRLIMNTMGLLAAQSVTETSEWNHYTRAAKGEAKRAKRKLPPVNVITLAARAQSSLDDHEAAKVERDGWWPVRGHFRMARVGPGRVNQRLCYVHPCVKGNREGPNIGRPQVRQTA